VDSRKPFEETPGGEQLVAARSVACWSLWVSCEGVPECPVLSKLRQHLTPPTPLSSCSLQITASGAILLGINMTVQDIAPASCLYNVGRGWRLLDW